MAGKKLNIFERILLLFVYGILRLWWFSMRIKISPQLREFLSSSDPRVIVFWHQKLFSVIEIRRRFRPHHIMCGMISLSHDGEWLASLVKKLEIQALRGSSSRNSAGVLRQAISQLQMGNDVVITPDGPRGPRFRFKTGAISAAINANVSLLTIRLRYRCAKKLSSWDAFQIPCPFSRIDLDGHLFSPDELRSYKSVQEAGEAVKKFLDEN